MPRVAATWRCCSGRARNGVPVGRADLQVCHAAKGGHLEVLQWGARGTACRGGTSGLAPRPRKTLVTWT